MSSTQPRRGWALATRVALSGAVAAALAGLLSALVGGATASVWIDRAEHGALLRIAREVAEEVAEEFEEELEEELEEHGLHNPETFQRALLEELMEEELEPFELPAAQASVWEGPTFVAGVSGLHPVPVGTCADGDRRRCAVRLDEGRLLVLSISRAMEPARTPLFLWAVLLGTLSGALLGGLASFTAARWALRPIEDLRTRLDGVRASNPSASVLEPPIAEHELEELRVALVDLVVRLGGALATARSFASEAAHELRTPLTTLSGEIDLLLERDVPQASVDALRRRVDGLIALVQRLLALGTPLTALDQSGLAVDLQDVVDDILAKHPHAARVQVHCASDVVVRGDEHLLQIMVANALDNALKFSEGLVELRVWRTEEQARVDVLDSGPGIKAEEATRVFEPFFRSPSARASGTPGHGVGLALIRRVAELHGGSAALTREGDQTRLRIDLSPWAT